MVKVCKTLKAGGAKKKKGVVKRRLKSNFTRICGYDNNPLNISFTTGHI